LLAGATRSSLSDLEREPERAEHPNQAVETGRRLAVLDLVDDAGRDAGRERELVYLAGIGIMVASVAALAALPAAPAPWAIYGYAVLLGLGYSVTASLIPAMVSDRFSGPHFGAIVGVGLMASAAGSAAGPWMAGWLFDFTGSYRLAFLIAGACGFAAGAAGWRARVLRVRAALR